MYGAKEFIGWYLANIEKVQVLKPHVGRKDHFKNYCFENIEIQSAAENSRESWLRTGLNTKLTAKKVKQIRAFLVEGMTQAAVAKKFGVHYSTIHYIKSGKTWQ